MAASAQAWGRSKLREMQRRWDAALGQEVRRMLPSVFREAPPEVILGFAANGSGDERTSLDERGYFGTEGPRWNSLRVRPEVKALLPGQRDAVEDPLWKASLGGTPDQVAVGLVNLKDHLSLSRGSIASRARTARSSADARPSRDDSLFALAVTFLGWSGGDGAAGRIVSAYRDVIAAAPEERRWGTLVYHLANDLALGRRQPGGRPDKHANNDAYTVLRTLQKLEAGRQLAQVTGGNTAWFDDGLGANREQIYEVLRRAAAHEPQVGGAGPAPRQDSPPVEGGGSGKVVAVVLLSLATSLALLAHGNQRAKEATRSPRPNPDDRGVDLRAHLQSPEVAYLEWLMVPSDLRGRGLGRRAYEAWERALPASVKLIRLHAADSGNGPSEGFWQALGFDYRYDFGEEVDAWEADYEASREMQKGVHGHPTPAPQQLER